MPSQKCSTCNNPTLDPSGRCHLHQSEAAVASPSAAAISAIPPTPEGIPTEWAQAYSKSQWEESVKEASLNTFVLLTAGSSGHYTGEAKGIDLDALPARWLAEDELEKYIVWSGDEDNGLGEVAFLDLATDCDYSTGKRILPWVVMLPREGGLTEDELDPGQFTITDSDGNRGFYGGGVIHYGGEKFW